MNVNIPKSKMMRSKFYKQKLQHAYNWDNYVTMMLTKAYIYCGDQHAYNLNG